MMQAAGFAFAVFFVFLAVHWTMFYLRPVPHRSRFLIRLTLGCVLVMFLRFARLHVSSGFAVAFVSFGSLWLLYMPFYYSIQTSLSVGMLIRLVSAGSQGIALEQLRANEHARTVVEQRLAAMVDAGYLRREGAKYVLTRKGNFVAQIFRGVEQLWKLSAGG